MALILLVAGTGQRSHLHSRSGLKSVRAAQLLQGLRYSHSGSFVAPTETAPGTFGMRVSKERELESGEIEGRVDDFFRPVRLGSRLPVIASIKSEVDR